MTSRPFARLTPVVLVVAGAFAVACDTPLEVKNLNNPDVAAAFGSPPSVENTIVALLFQQNFNGQYGTSDEIWMQSITMSMESHSTLGNFGMGTRALIPRVLIDNSIGNTVANGNFRDFDYYSRNARSAATAIARLDTFIATGKRLNVYPSGATSTGTAERDARAKAFAFFNLGYGLGFLSLLYDSAAVITPSIATDAVPEFSAAADVNITALAMLDSALAHAALATGQTLPSTWISDPAGGAMSMTRFSQVIRSYRARFRAGVARTPAQRAAVDWAKVIADATTGITTDFSVQTNASTGWLSSPQQQLRVQGQWSQMTPMVLGMADTSGGYRAWLATSLTARTPFLLKTPDKRFPAGEDRDAQTVASGGTSRAGPPASNPILYFRNRPAGEDGPGEPWGTWYYDNHRSWAIGNAGGNGPFIVFSVTENDMLAAEGYLRQGGASNIALAAALIDKTRLRANLPSVAGITTATGTVPGGNACVPQVPQGPGFTTTACGTIFEAMKWEKRVETSLTGYAQWFVDSRGWGDLPNETPLEWPVPYQELFARQRATYTNTNRAAMGNYGY